MRSYSSAYRTVAALLSVVLLAGSFLPALQHACAMGEASSPSPASQEACVHLSDEAERHAGHHQTAPATPAPATADVRPAGTPAPCTGLSCCTIAEPSDDALLARSLSTDLDHLASLPLHRRADAAFSRAVRSLKPFPSPYRFKPAVRLHVWTATFLN